MPGPFSLIESKMPWVRSCEDPVETGGKIVVAEQIYRGRFLFASTKL
jgi:hypothetical protein